jgi:hypothetical protein
MANPVGKEFCFSKTFFKKIIRRTPNRSTGSIRKTNVAVFRIRSDQNGARSRPLDGSGLPEIVRIDVAGKRRKASVWILENPTCDTAKYHMSGLIHFITHKSLILKFRLHAVFVFPELFQLIICVSLRFDS